jgi:protein O-mannosyl-transferase
MQTSVHQSRHVMAALGLLALVPYLNALRAGFTFDDVPMVRDNPLATHGIDPVGALTSTFFGHTYRPLTLLTFALNHSLVPGNPAAFHAVNLFLHAGVTVLVFVLASWLLESPLSAAVAAALFAVHPVHTEAVTGIVGRAELLAALFGLLALLGAARADAEADRQRRTAWQGGSLVCFALALLSKESAVSVVPLIFLLRVTLRKESVRTGLWREARCLDWVPYVVCAALFAVTRFWVVGSMTVDKITPIDNILAFVPWTARLRSAIGVLWDYFGLLNVPLRLAGDYSYAEVPVIDSWSDGRLLGGVALIVGAAVVCVRNRRPAVTLATLWPFVALAMTANVFFVIPTVKAERLLYFPSVGLVLLGGYACERLVAVRRYRNLAVAALCVVVALLAARTWVRNWDWRDNVAFSRSLVEAAPDNAKAHYNFGVALLGEGAYDSAITEFRRTLEIWPWPAAALAAGMAAQRKGRVDDAVVWYQKALQLMPAFEQAHRSLCGLLWKNGRFADAATACRRGLRYDPVDADLLKGLGESLLRGGDPERGADVLQRSLALNVRDRELRAQLARLAVPAASTRMDGGVGKP